MEKKNSMDSVVPMMESWFKPLPKLPANVIDFLVMVAPWFALVFGILGVLGALSAFGFMGAFGPMAAMYGARIGLWPLMIIGVLVSSILSVVAFPGLRDRKLQGWTLLFWSQIVSVLGAVVGINIGGIIGAAIGFYILFQVKPRYK